MALVSGEQKSGGEEVEVLFLPPPLKPSKLHPSCSPAMWSACACVRKKAATQEPRGGRGLQQSTATKASAATGTSTGAIAFVRFFFLCFSNRFPSSLFFSLVSASFSSLMAPHGAPRRSLALCVKEKARRGAQRRVERQRRDVFLLRFKRTTGNQSEKVREKTLFLPMQGSSPAAAVESAAALSLHSFPSAPPSPPLDELALSLGLTYDAVASIYSQGAQLAAAAPHARARRDEGPIAEKFASSIVAVDDGTSTSTSSTSSPSSSSFAKLDALSAAARVPAALLLRRILESAPFNVPRTAITDFMRCPRGAAAKMREGNGGGGAGTATWTSSSHLLLSAAADAAAAASALDPLYSPRGDALRHVAGLEAEALLCARLRSAGGGGGSGSGGGSGRSSGGGEREGSGGSEEQPEIENEIEIENESRGVPFWTEDALRAGGFALTPDARLATPVALPCGHVVHWIDSKATFGTVRMHE